MRFACLAGLLLASATLAQNRNLTVVKHWHRTPGTEYNDLLAFTSPTQREFVFVGEHTGIWLVETTDPANIKQSAWWPAPHSVWRDFASVGPFIYSVSEHHAGIRILDMRNPDAPKDLGYVETNAFTRAHNITADPDTGQLWVSGATRGLMIYDTAQDPTKPKLVGSWSTRYTHDCYVRRGRAYLANGRDFAVRIMDATNVAKITEIGRCNTPGGYAHNAWPTADDRLLCATDELGRNTSSPHMTVWDISKPTAPVLRGHYDLGTFVHDVVVLGRTAFLSHYTDGVHVVDLADPTKPARVASYDTSKMRPGWEGCWGVDPFSDHGLVYASDIQNGLWVFRMECGHMNRYGKGTPDANGRVPRMHFDGATPRVGARALRLEARGLQASSGSLLMLSAAPGNATFLGVTLHVDLGHAALFAITTDAAGAASIPLPIPNVPGLGGARLFLQVIGLDPATGKLTASRGMWAGICK